MTISIGINDVWHRLKGPHDEKILATYKENVGKMVDMAQKAGIKVILLTPTVIQENADTEGACPAAGSPGEGKNREGGGEMISYLPTCLLLTLASVLVTPLRGISAETTQSGGPDATDATIARLKKAGFPLVDFHIHLKGGLTIDEAVTLSRRTGIKYGIAANCGLKFPITDDRGIDRYVASLKGRPVFIGMQAEGREWPQLFSKAAIAKFDYVFTDAMTIVDHRGQRARLWVKEEVDIPDKQAFMELLVRTIVRILDEEPIDIYVNPTYLPDVLAAEYDTLWTPSRLDKVIDAAARNGVAIEISNRLRLPKPALIKQAKQAGIKFTFGTNNVDHNLGRLEYGLQMIEECGLTPQDMWMPKPDGRKPIQVRKK